MAPEVSVMFGRQTLHSDGYTDAVDWWGLGVLVFRMLTGREPFRPVSSSLLKSLFSPSFACAAEYESMFHEIFGDVNYNAMGLTLVGQSFVRDLLQFNPSARLGSGSSFPLDTKEYDRAVQIKHHPFFSDLDWELLEAKKLPPPYLPVDEIIPPPAVTSFSLEETLRRKGKGSWVNFDDDTDCNFCMLPQDQLPFDGWSYCSSEAVAEENKSASMFATDCCKCIP